MNGERRNRPPVFDSSFIVHRSSLLSDPGGIRTHTPRGGRLSTDPGYQLQHEVIRSGPGGIRTLTPVRAPASETGVTTRFHHQAMRTTWVQLQTRELNPASRLMRPGRAPARLQSLVVSGQLSVIRFCRGSVPTSLPTANCQLTTPQSDPWGNRTPTYRLRTCRPRPLDERASSHGHISSGSYGN